MMKLTATKASPFVRKVMIFIAVKGLTDRVEMVAEKADPVGYKAIRGANPLFKIPTLLDDSGVALQDSHVICEYLDTLSASPRLIPADPAGRIRVLGLASLADGIIESALSIVMEKRFRPEEKWVQSWIDRQQAKVNAGVDWLEHNVPTLGKTPDYGQITLACALGYLDFRHRGAWRDKHPKLVDWLDAFGALTPSFAATSPNDD